MYIDNDKQNRIQVATALQTYAIMVEEFRKVVTDKQEKLVLERIERKLKDKNIPSLQFQIDLAE